MANLEDLIDPEYGLQQDEWSLTRPRFGEEGQLEVIGWSGKICRTNKRYLLKCNLCIKDKDLFGDGIFYSIRGNLNKGCLPCGCTKRYKWTEDQMRIRCTRKADEIGFKLLGFVGEYKNHRTITRLGCEKHGEWESTADVLLYCGGGCPSCGRQKIEQSRKIPKSDVIKRVDKFCRDLNLKFLGFQGDYDAITRAKVVICCDVHGESVVSYRNLEKGCGCGACGKENIGSKNQKRRINESAILEDIQIFQDTGAFAEGTVFKRLLGRGGRKGTAAYWEVHCPECGGVGIAKAAHLRRGQRSCECSPHRMKEAYIHIIKDGGGFEVAYLKFGVAVNTENRIKNQRRGCIYNLENFGVWEFETKKSCLAAERECKQTLECGVLTKEEMPDGFTESTWVYNLDKIISIYEKHGGKRIK